MGIATLTPALRRRLEANLFPAAWPSIEPWNTFGWHGVDTEREHSSQALAIDVFGTLQQAPSRDAVLDALAAHLGWPTGGPWAVQVEWRDIKPNHLHERTRTAVDVLLTSPHLVVYGECKFTEHSGGQCSQTQRRSYGTPCNGHYALQTNPRNQRTAHCALTAKGIRYWDVIPTAFAYANDVEHHPCPFAGEAFQWMRNITGAVETARHQGKRAGFLLVYADDPSLPMTRYIRTGGWQAFVNQVRPEAIHIGAISYQALLQLACLAAPTDPLWPELTTWVTRKITNVCQKRKQRK